MCGSTHRLGKGRMFKGFRLLVGGFFDDHE
jgi:hypothetical protein